MVWENGHAMDTAAQLASTQPLVFLSHRFGLSGAALALAGLLVSLFCPVVEEVAHPPSKHLSLVFTETATQIKDKLTKPEVPVQAQRRVSFQRLTRIFAALIGFVGATLGTASWVRREDTKLAGVAVGLGLAAIAWNFFLIAVFSAIALLLLAWILSQFE